ncbi:hypothetical protein A8L34_08020 [Bacillus sp. FJAT-27264]|uniref:hypothetical protein n=1 Tax=Paenibacillus sp. (strain DSM 101736 / FJAT-27264) TaxID=1850362 RepID=UPI000807E60B|nr:hypothetical protein [Bacillus sp. FJAT-27264]OBZ19437.1 hypothetical protein A8L34_08020 [Bacillus sp. FJAT-27264]
MANALHRLTKIFVQAQDEFFVSKRLPTMYRTLSDWHPAIILPLQGQLLTRQCQQYSLLWSVVEAPVALTIQKEEAPQLTALLYLIFLKYRHMSKIRALLYLIFRKITLIGLFWKI